MNKQQTAVEWLESRITILEGLRDFGGISRVEYSEELTKVVQQAKEMEKEQMIDAINNVSENNVKYANMIVSSWSQIEGELFMHNTKVAEQYYEQTYGGGNK
jgi:hypothetical protein